jgi:hypothetical protein
VNRRSFVVALGVAMLVVTGGAEANGSIEVTTARLEAIPDPAPEPAGEGGSGGGSVASGHPGHTLLLSADIVLPLTETLKDSVNRGLALYFQTDVQLVRSRWYWWNEQVVAASIEWRLSYHALTRQYRVATNAQGQAFSTLDEALAVMSAIRSVPIARVENLAPGQPYEFAVRMRLDTGRLPKPFQMTAMTNRDWNPQSEWKRFDFIGPKRNGAR